MRFLQHIELLRLLEQPVLLRLMEKAPVPGPLNQNSSSRMIVSSRLGPTETIDAFTSSLSSR
jgi:hypothetical protein